MGSSLVTFSFSHLSLVGPRLSQRALAEEARRVRAALLRLERSPQRELPEELLQWRGYENVLALYGLKVAYLLRRKGGRAPLSFFALRVSRKEFDVPDWLD